MSTEPKDQVLDLKMPEWIPVAAKLAAAKIHQHEIMEGISDDIVLLNRLTSDERMKNVWRQLNSKRNEKSNPAKKFSHPSDFYFFYLAQSKRKKASELLREGGSYNEATARLLKDEADRLDQTSSEAPSSWSEKDCAIYCFFYGAYHLARDLQPLPKREDVKRIQHECSDAALQLTRLSETLRSLGMDRDGQELMRIACVVHEKAALVAVDFEENDFRVVERQRTNALLQSFVVQLAMINHVIFAGPLYGTLAVAASVALTLEKPVTRARIREILRSFPYSGMGGENAIPWD